MPENERFFVSIGGGNEIGGSSYLLHLGTACFLIDAGLRFSGENVQSPNYDCLPSFGLSSVNDVDAIFVTHAHLDHTGALPTVLEAARDVPVYATAPTCDIMNLLLKPNLQRSQLTGDVDLSSLVPTRVESALDRIRTVPMNETFRVAGWRVTFYHAGHILGAASIHFQSRDFSVLVTGDFSNFDQLTVPKYAYPPDFRADVLIMETTYGYHDDDRNPLVTNEREVFFSRVREVVHRGGIALIPAFSLGRAQEVCLVLKEFFPQHGAFPVFLDGMAEAVTRLYQTRLERPFFDGWIHTAPPDLLHRTKGLAGCIIASSGMLLDGSRSALYAERILPESRNCLFFTGYLDDESPGRRVLSLRDSSETMLNGDIVPVKAEIDQFKLSAHANFEGLLGVVECVRPKTVICVHGFPRPNVTNNIQREIYEKFGDRLMVSHPSNGSPVYF